MSRLNETFENAIYEFVASITGVDVIWDKQDALGSQKGKKPKLPYMTLNISAGPNKVSGSSEEYKIVEGTGVTDTFTYKHVKTFTLTINSHAKNGHLTLIGDIESGLDLPTKQVILRAAGLSVWNVGDPVDISVLQNTSHELRASIDIEMSYGVEIDDLPGEIQTVDIDGTLTSDAGTEHTVNINKTIVP